MCYKLNIILNMFNLKNLLYIDIRYLFFFKWTCLWWHNPPLFKWMFANFLNRYIYIYIFEIIDHQTNICCQKNEENFDNKMQHSSNGLLKIPKRIMMKMPLSFKWHEIWQYYQCWMQPFPKQRLIIFEMTTICSIYFIK
jgi:hypothetical protein